MLLLHVTLFNVVCFQKPVFYSNKPSAKAACEHPEAKTSSVTASLFGTEMRSTGCALKCAEFIRDLLDEFV